MRNYRKEYDNYQGKDEQKKNRAKRNNARRKFIREGKAAKGDGTEIDHIKPISKKGSNGKKNLRLVSRKTNRKKGAK